LWDTAKGETLFNWNAHQSRIRALAFSFDGAQLASAGEDRKINIWDVATAQLAGSLESAGSKVMAISLCGPNQLASGGSDNVIRIWDIQSKQEVRRLVGHTGSIATLDCNHHRRLLVSGSFDTTARLWRLDHRAASDGPLRGVELPVRTPVRR
jgi:WD40 repeat protein